MLRLTIATALVFLKLHMAFAESAAINAEVSEPATHAEMHAGYEYFVN